MFAVLLLAFAMQTVRPAPRPAQIDPRVRQHVQAGLSARDANRLDDAARELDAAAKLAPSMAEIHLNLGLVHHRRKDWKAAIPAFEAALNLKPQLTSVRDLLGFDYLMIGNLDRAQEYLEKALSETASADTSFWLGLVHLEQANYTQAAVRLEEARKSKPKDADLLFYLAKAYDRAAAEVRNQLVTTSPDSARAHMAAAEYAAFNGRRDEAIREYKTVASLDPQMPGVHGAIAELYADAAQHADAEESYRRELALAPQNARVNYRYGLVLLQLGKNEDAVRHLRIAVTTDPTLVDAQLNLGKALLQSGQPEQALTHLRIVTEAAVPDEMKRQAHYQMSLAYRKTGRPEEAARHLQLFEKLRER